MPSWPSSRHHRHLHHRRCLVQYTGDPTASGIQEWCSFHPPGQQGQPLDRQQQHRRHAIQHPPFSSFTHRPDEACVCHCRRRRRQHLVDLPPAMNQRRTSYRVLKGLPAYGPMAISFPESRARFGREGFVVEFNNEYGSSWVGNFLSGSSGECNVMWHPDGLHVLVFTEGDLWSVDPISKTAGELAGGCSAVWPLDSGDLLIQESGLYFFRLGREGIVWHTSRISWDGFQNVRIESNKLRGEAWSPFGDGHRRPNEGGGVGQWMHTSRFQ